jgi:hypothetical protein
MNGSSLYPNPAITGWQKYGLNLQFTILNLQSESHLNSNRMQNETYILSFMQYLHHKIGSHLNTN